MLKAIKHGMTHLTEFSGRDARQAFWYFVLFLVIINMALGLLMTIPMMVSSFQTVFQAAQAGLTEEQLMLQISSQMAEQMESTMWVSLAANLVMTFLLAAAFVRRLHDSDRSGWWAALVVAVQLGATIFSATQIGRTKELVAASMDPDNLPA